VYDRPECRSRIPLQEAGRPLRSPGAKPLEPFGKGSKLSMREHGAPGLFALPRSPVYGAARPSVQLPTGRAEGALYTQIAVEDKRCVAL
jgi:hypothetical protein